MKITKSLISGAALICAMVALAAGQSVVGSHHDLRVTGGGTPTATGMTEVCVSCHTPHQPTGITQDPLWNHTLSTTASYGVYGSTTLNATPTDIGAATQGSATVSHLCLSCHDGTVSVVSMYNPPETGQPTVTAIAGVIDASGKIVSTANIGSDLSNDHPINFTYDAALVTADGGLKAPATAVASGVRLFGGSVQCASCHDPHNDTNMPFLRVSNVASALCTSCHNK